MPHRRTSPEVFSNARELRHNQTEAEAKLWQVLRLHRDGEVHFRRQHAIGPYVVDFCAPHRKLVIEVDGSQHMDHQDYDEKRTAFLESQGYQVIRFTNNDVLFNLDGVGKVIAEAIEEHPLPTSPKIKKAILGEVSLK